MLYFLTAALAILPILPTTSAGLVVQNTTNVNLQGVRFMNHWGIDLAGNLRHPLILDNATRYPAIVTVAPAGGAKEQAAGLYAQKLAEEGFVTLAYDASFQGQSGGEPRNQENPIARVEDIRSAVDFLVSLPYVDENRIGVLGLCAGGGYAVSATMTERRIQAAGIAVPVIGGGGGGDRGALADATISALQDVAQLRTAEARGEQPIIAEFIPDSYRNSTDIDNREAYDYYRTARNPHPAWENMLRSSTMDANQAYDAYHLTDTLLTQPLEIIVGSELGSFGSNQHGHALYQVAASASKNLTVFEGASHFDLYDNLDYVNPAVAQFSAFFRSSLP